VLQLIGIVMDADQMPLVVLPFMTHGDLLSYIRNENNSPSVRDLMEFGIQIADGMAYLSNLKFVHRDLAARNCMLDDSMVVKVADFGLSRDIYERDYYSSDDRKAKLPVKWMALESLEKGIYNTRTDIWSYGVVLWELMTRGVCPYPEVDNWDIVKYLKLGRRMLQPSYCPDALYGLMLRCWDVEPGRRPLFPELSVSVRNIITTMQVMGHRHVGLGVNYINTTDTTVKSSSADYLNPNVSSVLLADYNQSVQRRDDHSETVALKQVISDEQSPAAACSDFFELQQFQSTANYKQLPQHDSHASDKSCSDNTLVDDHECSCTDIQGACISVHGTIV
jgi:proto-oncogene tyrosine-protein kinase Met